ncbi:hypothetical protein [Streptomyces boninensis]|uniref:hypothetical protein n=1 Tax=Streptomyces boninensis TaxID=2039455 RepID=UPI003B21280A
MASIRTARVLAAVASVPLAAALFTGVATADNGAFADDGSISGATSQTNGGDNYGVSVSSSNQQNNTGIGNSNQGASAIGDGNVQTQIAFSPLW